MKTCPSCETTYTDDNNFCSHEECGGARLKSVEDSDSLPVRLEVNPGTNPTPGCPAVLECRLTNLSDQTLESEVRLQTDDDVTVLLSGEPVRLIAGRSSPPVPLRFRPDSSGHFNLTLLVEIGERGWFESRIKYEVAQAANGSANHVMIDAFKVKGHEGRTGVGDNSTQGTITVNMPDRTEAKPVRPHEWTEAALFPSGGPKQTLDRVRPRPSTQTNRLTLTLRSPGESPQDICVIAGREICLGRNRSVDLRVRIAPVDDSTNDPRESEYQSISREHAVIRFEPGGPVWKNSEGRILDDGSNSHQGTVFNNRLLAAAESFPVRDGAVIRPADVTSLCASLGRDEHHDLADYRCFVEHRLNAGYQPSVGPVQALHLTRTDSLANVESYVVMQELFEIGRDPHCALTVQNSSLRMRHARILHLGGWFWIESLSRNALVEYESQPLPVDTLAPLVPGAELKLGGVEIDVSTFRQHILDCTCPEHQWT